MSAKWPKDLSLFVNGGPDDECGLWDVWHDGGPGGPFCDVYGEESAEMLCAAINELHRLRRAAAVEQGDEAEAPPGWVWNDECGGWESQHHGAVIVEEHSGRKRVARAEWLRMTRDGDITQVACTDWHDWIIDAMDEADDTELAEAWGSP